jgi:hypothetical protein
VFRKQEIQQAQQYDAVDHDDRHNVPAGQASKQASKQPSTHAHELHTRACTLMLAQMQTCTFTKKQGCRAESLLVQGYACC